MFSKRAADADGSGRKDVSKGGVMEGWRMMMVVLAVLVKCLVFKDGFLLTSRGVPGMEPYVELVRVLGGVRMRRPNLSNLAGEAAREAKAPEPAESVETVRWWLQ